MNRYFKKNDINSTFSFEETDIGVNKPLISTKINSIKTTMINNTSIIPKIIITDYSQNSLLRETDRIVMKDLDHLEKNLVEEMNIEQFHQDLSIKTNANNEKISLTSKIHNFKEDFSTNHGLNIYDSSYSNSNLSSCFSICKTAKPANIEIELFDCFDNNMNEAESNKIEIPDDLNNNNLDNQNKNITLLLSRFNVTSKLKSIKKNFYIFENDEYNFNNFRNFKLSNLDKDSKDIEKLLNNKTRSKFKIAVKSIVSNTQANMNIKDIDLNSKDDKLNSEVALFSSISKSEVELNINYEYKYENYFLYVSFEEYRNIFKKKCIDLEAFFYNDKLLNGIIFLILPPETDDLILLNQLYGSKVLVNLNRIECVIRLKKEILEKNEKHLIKLDKFKYAFTKRILFGRNFPKHEFRSKINFNYEPLN
jgi:hypothetical protein